MSERIRMLHPQGKQGMNIEKAKYDVIRAELLSVIGEAGTITFRALLEEMNARLQGKFDGSISWYTTSVKLHLEALGEIERVQGSKPQQIRISQDR